MRILIALLLLATPALADTTCDPKLQNCSSDASYRYGRLASAPDLRDAGRVRIVLPSAVIVVEPTAPQR